MRGKAEAADTERAQDKIVVTIRGGGQREMRSGKGPRVWAAHFEFLVFLQLVTLDLREAPGLLRESAELRSLWAQTSSSRSTARSELGCNASSDSFLPTGPSASPRASSPFAPAPHSAPSVPESVRPKERPKGLGINRLAILIVIKGQKDS